MQETFPCPKCGSQNIIGARACEACGKSLQYKCPQCDAIIDPEFTTCPKCGAGLDWPINEQAKPLPPLAKTTYQRQEKFYEESSPTQKRRSPIIILSLAVIAISLVAGFAIHIASQGTASTGTSGASSSGPEITPAIEEITVDELLQAYYTDRKAAEAEYKGKILNVTGVVDSVGKNVVGTSFVKLAGNSIEPWRVQCMFDKKYESELAELTRAQIITIQGKCGDYLPPDVAMTDCILVQ